MSGTRVTASGARAVAAPGAPPRSGGRLRPWAVPAVIIAATVLAIGLRIYDLTRPGYLFGVSEYDDGTDFGSAVRLIHGALPYRDFIMVQPPGIALIMAPVALITKGMGTITGMAVARVVTALAGAAAVPVAGLLTRHRGLFAVLVSCGVLAVFPDSILAARTVLLEPWLVLFCLLGALAVFDGDRLTGGRRLLAGGVLFGVAGAVKVWAILPVVVILALTARRPREAARFAGGVAIGFLALVLPFALTAPSTFYRSVVVAQLVRVDLARIPQGYRLQQILGLTHVSQLATPALTIIGIVVVVLIAAVMVLGSRLAHTPPPALEAFAAGTCALLVASFLWPADFYYHYAAFLAPFLALVLALPVSRLLAALPAARRPEARPAGPAERATQPEAPPVASGVASGAQAGVAPAGGRTGTSAGVAPAGGRTRSRPAALRLAALRPAAVVVAGLALVVLTVLQVTAEYHESSGVPAGELTAAQRMIPPGACVATDQASYTIAIDRFVSSAPGCSLMIDGVGTDYALSNGRNGQTGAGRSPAVAAAWLAAFRTAKYAWLTSQQSRRIPWTPGLTAYFESHFVPLTEGPDWLYIRAPHNPG